MKKLYVIIVIVLLLGGLLIGSYNEWFQRERL